MKLLKQATYIRYVLAKLSKFVQISTRPPHIFFTENSLKIKKGLELVSKPYFSHKYFVKNFSLVMLHKLVKFHHQTVFTSQIIQ